MTTADVPAASYSSARLGYGTLAGWRPFHPAPGILQANPLGRAVNSGQMTIVCAAAVLG